MTPEGHFSKVPLLKGHKALLFLSKWGFQKSENYTIK